MIFLSKELYVVDENGEVIDKIEAQDKYVKLSNGDKVVRKGVLQYLSDTTDIRYHFVKINPLIYGKIANRYPILNSMIEYLGYMDNILSYRNGVNIQVKDLPKICNVSESTIKRQLKGLLDEDVIHKVKENKKWHLVVNPFVAMRGREIYLSLYEEFKLSHLRTEVEEWEK